MNNLKRILLSGLTTGCVLCAGAETVMMHTPESFQVLGISANGEWACGVFVDATLNTLAFRWDLNSGSIDLMGSQASMAWDVSNDGTVSGEYGGVPAYYRDGAWHRVEIPASASADGIVGSISPDGHYMTGSLAVGGVYVPFIWRDGAVYKSFATGSHAVSYAVSPDGEKCAGFNTLYNRTACVWSDQGIEYFTDSPEYSMSPWNYSRNFSPDGTKLVYWGGWEVDADDQPWLYCMYDLTTGEHIKVQSPSIESDLEFYDITDDGMMVGGNLSRGYVYTDGQGIYIDDYLALKGVDMSGFDDFYNGEDYYTNSLPITRVVAASADGKCLAMNYYNTRGQQSSMVVKLDRDFTAVSPVEVKARQLDGLHAVELSWKRPVGANNIRGYNIYRDGVKLNPLLPINALSYYDNKVGAGTYTYEISAITVAGVETRSQAFTIEVKDAEAQMPLQLYGRQKGVNNIYMQWLSPLSQIIHKHYYNPDNNELGEFAIYDNVPVEVAIAYDKGEMASYAGYKITEVSFYPLSEQRSWTINLYTRDSSGALQRLATQPVTQQLVYNTRNTVVLDTPVDVPSGALIVGIEIDVNNIEKPIIGSQSGKVTPGYSDLLRQMTESDYISTYESSLQQAWFITSISWSIDLGLQPADYSTTDNALSHYNIYMDGEKVGETTDNTYAIAGVSNGTHTVGVDAIYANGAVSTKAETSVWTFAKYPAVNDVTIDTGAEGNTTVTATWQTPVDNDTQSVAYTSATTSGMGIKGPAANGYALMVGAIYPMSVVHGYDGYRIDSFKFYPLTDALYTFMLYEDDNLICELEVDDFTIGQWNTIALPVDIRIKENSSYLLALDCFDPIPDTDIIAIDSSRPRDYYSDLYSLDNGETWNSLTNDTGTYGNWMIGMEISMADPMPLDVEGYDLVVDGRKVNSDKVVDTTYAFDMTTVDDKRHTLRVNTYYADRYGAVNGGVREFYMTVSGVNDAMIATININKGENYLVVEGDGVQVVEIYDMTGRCVAKAAGNRVEIGQLSPAVYVVSVATDNGVVTRKIMIEG